MAELSKLRDGLKLALARTDATESEEEQVTTAQLAEQIKTLRSERSEATQIPLRANEFSRRQRHGQTRGTRSKAERTAATNQDMNDRQNAANSSEQFEVPSIDGTPMESVQAQNQHASDLPAEDWRDCRLPSRP